MKKALLTLFVLLPLVSVAELSVICRPSSPILQPDNELEVLIYIRNDGEEAVLVPWGLPNNNKHISPEYSYSLKVIAFKKDNFKVIARGAGASGSSGFACSFEPNSSCTPLRTLATFLEPGETLVYEVSYGHVSDEKIPDVPFDMYILNFEFSGFDIPIPPVTLLPEERKGVGDN